MQCVERISQSCTPGLGSADCDCMQFISTLIKGVGEISSVFFGVTIWWYLNCCCQGNYRAYVYFPDAKVGVY